jgi:hypothetical protein
MGMGMGVGGIAQEAGIGFAQTEVWVTEASPTVTLRVLRGGDDVAPFTVDYRTQEVGARAGADFVAAAGTLEFAEGENIKLVVIELINDVLREGTEQFRVTLSNPSEGRRVGSGDAAVNIEDNDPGVGFNGNDVWFNENQSMATLTVRRGSDLPGAFAVQYATANGTARTDSDYMAASGTLEFGESEESKTIEIELLNDAVTESEETFTVRLSNPSGGRVLDPQNTAVTVRIGDNDLGVGFVPGWISAPEEGGPVELRVERQTDYAGPFRVSFTTLRFSSGNTEVGSATAGQDYAQNSGVLEFGERENIKLVSVEILNDAQRELNEEFMVTLSQVSVASLGIFQSATVLIEDNDPGIHFDPVEVRVLEAEPQVELAVHRGADTQEAFTVDYATRAIPGSGGDDVPTVNGTIAFGEGEMSRTLTLPLPDDDGVWEGDQEFEVVLSRPVGGGVLDPDRNVGRVLAVDNEAPVRWEAHWVGEPFPEVWGLQAVTWGGGRYVAVGGEWVVVSEDGRQWTARQVNGFGAGDVIWAAGEYLAVGDSGIWRSAEGLDWTSVDGAAPRNLFRLSHGDGVYVALDRYGRAWMTSDLASWSSETLGPNLQDLAYGNGTFVVVGDDGKAWYWQPGRTWEALGKIAPGWLGAVTWGNVGFVTASSQYDEQAQSEYLLVLDSWDGRTWWTNRVDEPMSTPNYLVYGDGAYLGVSWNRVVRLAWNGDHWLAESSAGISSSWYSVGDLAYGHSGYVSSSYSTISVSGDGLLWERLGRMDLRDVEGTGGRFFVEHLTGDGWHGGYFEIRTSVDAVSWALEQSGGFRGDPGPGLTGMNGVVGYLRGGTLHLRARDGTWRTVTVAEQGWVSALAAGAGQWVVVGRQPDEAAQRDRVAVYRSVDGEEWEAHFPTFTGDLNRVLHAGEWFYAMGNEENTGEVVMQSADGLAWQKSGLSGRYELYAVAQGKGLYVAAARATADDGRVLLRSADGMNWVVAKRFNLVDVWSADVEYGSGLFAVTWRSWWWQEFPEQATYLSRDGVDWRRHTPSLGGSVTAFEYSDGRLVAVGPGGLVLRSQPLVYLGEPRLDANGSITVWFEGEGGREYTVEGTSDLEEWTAVGTARPSLSAQEIALPIEAAGHRFYRLRAVE